MREEANIDFRVFSVQTLSFIPDVGGTGDISMGMDQPAIFVRSWSNLHVNCVELVPTVMIVHTMFVVYCALGR